MPHLPYKRADRVAGEAYNVVAEVFRYELTDPRLKGVELTAARMSDDLRLLTVYYYVEGNEDRRKRLKKGLESATGYIKRALADRLGLRATPDLRYFFDSSVEEGGKMDDILGGLDVKPDETQEGE